MSNLENEAKGLCTAARLDLGRLRSPSGSTRSGLLAPPVSREQILVRRGRGPRLPPLGLPTGPVSRFFWQIRGTTQVSRARRHREVPPPSRFRKSGQERGGRGLARRGRPRLEFAALPAPPSPRPPPSLPHSPWRERLTEPGEETAFAAALPPRPALTRASSAGNGEQRWGSGRRPRSQ